MGMVPPGQQLVWPGLDAKLRPAIDPDLSNHEEDEDDEEDVEGVEVVEVIVTEDAPLTLVRVGANVYRVRHGSREIYEGPINVKEDEDNERVDT